MEEFNLNKIRYSAAFKHIDDEDYATIKEFKFS